MEILDYGEAGFEEAAFALAKERKHFGLRIKGWRCAAIRSGLKPYLGYRAAYQAGGRRPLTALAVVPFAFAAPTFWVICIRAEVNGLAPRIALDASNTLIVEFE